MKKIEELGISPAPWTVPQIDNDFVHDSNGESVCQVNMIAEDAPLIAAAPELYDAGQKTEAVLTGLFKLDEFAALLKSGAADALIACRDELRKALAKASGEEVDNG